MASQSQNAMNVSSTISPMNGSSGSSTTISVCTTKMQSLTSSQSYQQHSSPSSSPSPSPSPSLMQQQHQTLQSNNIETIDKNSSNTLKVCLRNFEFKKKFI